MLRNRNLFPAEIVLPEMPDLENETPFGERRQRRARHQGNHKRCCQAPTRTEQVLIGPQGKRRCDKTRKFRAQESEIRQSPTRLMVAAGLLEHQRHLSSEHAAV